MWRNHNLSNSDQTDRQLLASGCSSVPQVPPPASCLLPPDCRAAAISQRTHTCVPVAGRLSPAAGPTSPSLPGAEVDLWGWVSRWRRAASCPPYSPKPPAPLTWFPRTVRVRTRWLKRGGSRSRSGWDWPRRGPPPWPDWTTLCPDQQVRVTARFLSEPGAFAWFSPNYRQVTDLLLCHCLSVKPLKPLCSHLCLSVVIYVSEHHSYKKADKIMGKREK